MLLLICVLVLGAIAVCYGLDLARTGLRYNTSTGIGIMVIAGTITVMFGNIALWYV